MTQRIDPSIVAEKYRAEVKEEILKNGLKLKVVGFLTSNMAPSVAYAGYTDFGCQDVGIEFELRKIPRLEIENAIKEANEDPTIHGIFIYYPVMGLEQDNYLKDQVDFKKDIEGLNTFWLKKLYENDRTALGDGNLDKKAILPCTPLAIVKIFTEIGICDPTKDHPFEGKTVTIFNRSEIVGRPLAAMISHDGAHVHSFDVSGPITFDEGKISESNISRADALKESDIVVTGVPSKSFKKISMCELKEGAICLNFSTIQNFDEDVKNSSMFFTPRVGPVTVAMCTRNILRLYNNFHVSK